MLKNVFFLYQNSIKNGSRSSLGPKYAQKNHFKSFLGHFRPNSYFGKKVPKNVLKCSKMQYF